MYLNKFLILLDCSTSEGKQCVSSFKYKGGSFSGCTSVDNKDAENNDVFWCSTLTDQNGNHIRGNWGNCICKKGNFSFKTTNRLCIHNCNSCF